MKHLLHVFPAGPARFDVRITVLGSRFRSIETFESPRRAAFYADAFKTVLRDRYALHVVLTLCPDVFVSTSESLGICNDNTDDLFRGLPDSFRCFIMDNDPTLVEFRITQDSVAAELANLKADSKAVIEAKSRQKMAEYVARAEAKVKAQNV